MGQGRPIDGGPADFVGVRAPGGQQAGNGCSVTEAHVDEQWTGIMSDRLGVNLERMLQATMDQAMDGAQMAFAVAGAAGFAIMPRTVSSAGHGAVDPVVQRSMQAYGIGEPSQGQIACTHQVVDTLARGENLTASTTEDRGRRCSRGSEALSSP